MSQLLIHEATKNDVPTIVGLLAEMQAEIKELPLDIEITRESVTLSMDELVHWFLFRTEDGELAGSCYLQSVHNYWRLRKRYLLGGFYLRPSHRGNGSFKDLVQQLKDWAAMHGGRQIFAFIDKNNEKSLGAFDSVGVSESEMVLRICNF